MKWILCVLALTGVLLRPALSSLTSEEFKLTIEPLCFKNKDNADTLLVNGQEVPLASTLENFMSLVEKLEVANPGLTLEEELFFLLRNFVYENIAFSDKGKIFGWTPNNADYTVVRNLWEPSEERRGRMPDVDDFLTNEEKCSLFFMLSHTIMLQPMKVAKSVERVYLNASYDSLMRADGGNMDDLYPHEQGIVAIRGTEQAVALGRVLTGMYVGLKDANQRRMQLGSLKKFPPNFEKASEMLDPLYALTLSDVLVMAQWPFENLRDNLAPNGKWAASPSAKTLHDVQEVCPSVYKLPPETQSMYSYSTVRGAADGLILGQIIHDLYQQRSNTRLSQIIRMYYSQRGIRLLQGRENGATVSFCSRKLFVESVENTLHEQMQLLGLLVSPSTGDAEEAVKDAWDYYVSLKSDIYGDRGVSDMMCPSAVDPNDPTKKYLLETPLDFLVVLDSANNIETQQLIVGHLVNRLELRAGGGNITVLLDQREGTSGLNLKPIVNETFNTACAACMVTQRTTASGAAEKDIVIQAIDEFLQNRKKREENLNGVKRKIVIYFNLDETETESYRLTRALQSFRLTHQDVSVYALGKKTEVLKKYVRNDEHHIISIGDQPAEVAKILYEKVIKDPAVLQYTDCSSARSESGATFEEFVSPYVLQHWAMPPKYFLKSFGVKFTFEADYGHLQVCFSRASPNTENQIKNCRNTTGNERKIEFRDTNPCKSFSEITCPPLYFSVMGLNATENSASNQYCQDTTTVKCKALDQVKFKVTHDGVRCSGAFGLLSTPLLMVLAFLLLQMLTKKL